MVNQLVDVGNQKTSQVLSYRILYISTYFRDTLVNKFGFILGQNLLVAIFILLSLASSYLLFNFLLNRRDLSVIFSLLYTFSTYFLYRVFSLTFNLYGVFVFPLSIYFLARFNHDIRFAVFITVFTFFTFQISAYYGYFILILVSLWFFLDIFSKRRISYIRVLFIYVILSLILSLTIFYPFFKIRASSINTGNTLMLERPIEDFYSFSFRPWYFFIPPERSIFFGDFSDKILRVIESSNYYLADDYAAEEMAGTYMGWHFILGFLFVLMLLIKEVVSGKDLTYFKNIYQRKDLIMYCIVISFILFLINLPPSFTVRGIRFYTPSYLSYMFFPFFRVLVRWSAVIYLLVLIVNSFLLLDIIKLFKTQLTKNIFIIFFVILNFVIFGIRLPIIDTDKPPCEIRAIRDLSQKSATLIVYPPPNYYSTFWTVVHGKKLLNPKNLVYGGVNFDELSELIVTKDGINNILDQKPDYLVYYKKRVSNSDLKYITKLNTEITTYKDLETFFEENFGLSIYESNEIIIYQNKEALHYNYE